MNKIQGKKKVVDLLATHSLLLSELDGSMLDLKLSLEDNNHKICRNLALLLNHLRQKSKNAKRLQKQANARVQDSDFIKTKMIYDRIRKKYQVSANDQQEDIIYLKTTIDEESVFKIFDSKIKEILNITLTKNSQKKSNVDYLLNFIIKECEPYLKLDLQKNSKLKAMILAYYPDRNKDHEDLSGYWIQKCNVISGVLFEIKKAFPYLWKN